MHTNQPRERKKKPFLWIVVVAVLLAGAYVLYALSMRTYPPRVPVQVVARGKIPPPPPSPAVDSPDEPSTFVESASSAGVDSPESASGTRSDLEAASDDDGPRNSAPEMKSQIAGPSQEDDDADTDQEPVDDAELARATGPADGSASSPGADDARPAEAAGALQVAVPETPESPASPETVASGPSELPATDSQPAPAATSPGDTEPATRYAIQVGAYRAKDNADRHVAQLQERGFDAYLYETSDGSRREWYFVRFGRFQDFRSAHKALAAFTKKERMDGTIVRSNSTSQ